MVFTRGFGSGASVQDRPRLTKDQVKEMIHAKDVSIVRGQIPNLFGSIKTSMMEFFDDRYNALSKADVVAATVVFAAAGIGTGRAFQYHDFDNMNHLVFDGVYDPIIAMMWISYIEGCFFTCTCHADHRVWCALNLLRP